MPVVSINVWPPMTWLTLEVKSEILLISVVGPSDGLKTATLSITQELEEIQESLEILAPGAISAQ